MKKILLFMMALVTVLSLTACKGAAGQQDKNKSENLEGTLKELIEKIYETADIKDESREYFTNGTTLQEVDSETAQYYLGKSDIEFEEALASEPMIQPGAYSLVLVRVKEGADIEKIKTDIKENVDPRKWICVGVSEENIIVDNIGDIIFLVMSDNEAKPLHEAFLALGR